MSKYDANGVEQTSDGGGAGGGDLFDADGNDVTMAGTGGGGGPPTGAAGGDLSGTYPNPSVVNDSHNHTASTLPSTIVYDGDPAGGDLSGTYPNPSVVDDSHFHTSATVPVGDGTLIWMGL